MKIFNPVALRTIWSFDCSECNRVNSMTVVLTDFLILGKKIGTKERDLVFLSQSCS